MGMGMSRRRTRGSSAGLASLTSSSSMTSLTAKVEAEVSAAADATNGRRRDALQTIS
jgi:hypothetical protein